MGLLQIYSTNTPYSKTERQTFCDCSEKNKNVKSQIPAVCHCGEDACRTMEWQWDTTLVQQQSDVNGPNISFHRSYSQGTSMVRGQKELRKGVIHYWEIKVDSWFPGTDLMVGIGTEMVALFEHRYKFSSALGLDNQSWGFSYRGMAQHKNLLKYYGKPFSTHSIIGVYLDLFKGHLEFYVNRIPLGIAYKNIPVDPDTKLYPMVCSTSAKSCVRLINATSLQDSLQFRCMAVISKYSQLLETVRKMPGFSLLCRELWFMLPKERYQYTAKCNKTVDEFDIIGAAINDDTNEDDEKYYSSNESLDY